jgi:hypothetical protein
MFHDFFSIPPVAGSSKNRETPFRGEIKDKVLRCFAQMVLSYFSQFQGSSGAHE